MRPNPPPVRFKKLTPQIATPMAPTPPAKRGQFLRRLVGWVRLGRSQHTPPQSPANAQVQTTNSLRTLKHYAVTDPSQQARFFRDTPDSCYALRLQHIDKNFANTELTQNDQYRALKQTFGEYEALLKAPVAKNQYRRARQATQALQKLDKLESRLLPLYNGIRIPAQRNAVSSLLAQVDSERHLITRTLNNTNFDSTTALPRWSDAIGLRRVGLTYGACPTLLDSKFENLSVLGAGSFNIVFSCTDATNGKPYVYKPEVSLDEAMGCLRKVVQEGGARISDSTKSDTTHAAMIEMPRYAARNLAIHNINKLLACDVIVESRIAKIPLEHLARIDAQVVARRMDQKGQHFLSDYGLLMDHAQGTSLSRLLTRQPDSIRGVLQDNAFKRDLVNIQWMDAIAGSMDRHPGNIMVDIDDTGQYRGLKGIDNDLSLFGHDYRLKEARGRSRKEIADVLPDAFRIRDKDRMLETTQYLDALIEKCGGLVPNGTNPETLPSPRLQSAFDHLRELCSKWNHASIRSSKYMMRADWFEQRMVAMGDIINHAHEIYQFTQNDAFRDLPAIQDYGRRFLDTAEQRFRIDNMRAQGHMYNKMHGGANRMGLPRVIDTQLAQKLEDPGLVSRIAQSSAELLTPAEFAQLESRLETIRTHITQLRTEGRVIENWNMPADQLNALVRDEVYSTYSLIEEFLAGQR